MPLNLEEIRKEFPILKRMVYGKPLVYLDNAATTQKPERVLSALSNYYRTVNSNIHRGIYSISMEATDLFEQSRASVQQLINARESREIIFTRGTTEAINLVAYSFSERYLKEGDEVLISMMEHHSNIIPWQLACQRRGASLKAIPVTAGGELDLSTLDALLTKRTRILALTHVSNVTGGPNPVKEIIARAHAKSIPVLLDGAQSIPHLLVDVQDLDCDFYAFSAHKMYGPMGVGVLFGKAEILEEMPPWQGGGEMIDQVSLDHTTYNDLPFKFEAGTSAVSSAIAFKEAIDFMNEIGREDIHHYEQELLAYTREEMQSVPGLRFYGDGPGNCGVLSFLIDGVHPYDLGSVLDKFGIAIRTGNHCAQPLMDFWGIPGTMRVSLAVYNSPQEIDTFVSSLKKAIQIFL